MNNIIIKKIYDEAGLINLEVRAISEFISAYQYCYIQDINLVTNAEKIIAYSKDLKADCYVEFGEKDGEYTPAFSLKFLKADLRGRMKIEVDIEIADNATRSHRCCFYVDGESGRVEEFGKALRKLELANVGTEIRLYE